MDPNGNYNGYNNGYQNSGYVDPNFNNGGYNNATGYNTTGYVDPNMTGYNTTGYVDPNATGYNTTGYVDPNMTGYNTTGYVDPNATGYVDPNASNNVGYNDPNSGNNDDSGYFGNFWSSSKQPAKIPEGHKLEFTETGLPRVRKHKTNPDDVAENEFVNEVLPLNISLDEVQERFGIGTRLFFDFQKAITISNFVLAILGLSSWIDHLAHKLTPGFSENDLFVSAYDQSQRSMWLITNILAILVWFFFGPCYFISIRMLVKRNQIDDYDNHFAYGEGLDTIEPNLPYTPQQRLYRKIASYVIFFVLIIGSSIAVYYIEGLYKIYGNPNEIINIYNFVITGAVGIINVIFSKIAYLLTDMEKFTTWGEYRKNALFRLLAFKIINIIAMYAALQFAFAESGTCIFEDTGSKFLSLLITDILLFNGLGIVLPLFKSWLVGRIDLLRGKGSDESNKPVFDISQEYLELFYRQFIIYTGMTSFPLVTVIGLIFNLIQYPLDKYRMLRICQTPERIDITMKRFISSWLFIIAVVALVAWPEGAIYILQLNRNDGPNFECCLILGGTGNAASC